MRALISKPDPIHRTPSRYYRFLYIVNNFHVYLHTYQE